MLSGNSARLGNDNGGYIASMIGDIVMFKIVLLACHSMPR